MDGFKGWESKGAKGDRFCKRWLLPCVAMKRIWKGFMAGLVLGIALVGTGCGPSKPKAKMANVTAGTMPANGTFKGVWYNEAFGELHLVPEGGNVIGKWKDKTHGRWGKMSGTISGDLMKFRWEEHKMGAIGPGATTIGRGYFRFIPAEEGYLPRLKGEWGFEESEVGGGNWDMNRVQDREPDLNDVKSDEDPTVDSGWDQDPKKDAKLALFVVTKRSRHPQGALDLHAKPCGVLCTEYEAVLHRNQIVFEVGSRCSGDTRNEWTRGRWSSPRKPVVQTELG